MTTANSHCDDRDELRTTMVATAMVAMRQQWIAIIEHRYYPSSNVYITVSLEGQVWKGAKLLIYKSLDGMFKEWKVARKGRVGGDRCVVPNVSCLILPVLLSSLRGVFSFMAAAAAIRPLLVELISYTPFAVLSTSHAVGETSSQSNKLCFCSIFPAA